MRTRVAGSSSDAAVTSLHSAFHSHRRVDGLTHAIYRYPARFSPEFVQAALDAFSAPNDYVLDPFLGGGTSGVEALAQGRRFVGVDVNPLAIVLTRAKTTPLTAPDRRALRDWVERSFETDGRIPPSDPRLRNAPPQLTRTLAALAATARALPTDRQRDAAHAVLLSVGQWAIDGRSSPVPETAIYPAMDAHLSRLFAGLDDLSEQTVGHGIRPSDIPRRRLLRNADAREAAAHRGWNRLVGRVGLVLTSPPYPGVHVLYHRWQVGGRSETPLPYWLTDLQDGSGPKLYTMGGRSALGQARYFDQMSATWTSIRRLLRSDALVVQLVAFSRPDEQRGTYLSVMESAGYHHVPDLEPDETRLVPNRRWYNRVEPSRGWAREVLMVHSPSRR